MLYIKFKYKKYCKQVFHEHIIIVGTYYYKYYACKKKLRNFYFELL